jgi:hypothetical protein
MLNKKINGFYEKFVSPPEIFSNFENFRILKNYFRSSSKAKRYMELKPKKNDIGIAVLV